MNWNARLKPVLAFLSFCIAAPLHASQWTNTDFSILPSYCAVKVRDNNPQTTQVWINQMGRENWVHIHHYCGGLLALHKYYGQNAYEQGRSLSGAVWEFDYVLKNTLPDFYLRPDFHYNRGRAFRLQGKTGPALTDFMKAIELSPGMPSASIELADLYKKQGKKDLAFNTVKKALESNPANKGLRRRYQEMGGDLAAIQTTPEVVPEKMVSPVVGSNPGDVPESKVEPEPPITKTTPEVIEQKIGNEINPWCRFCPDPPVQLNHKL